MRRKRPPVDPALQLDISLPICPACKNQHAKAMKTWIIKGKVQAKGKTRGTYVKGKYNITEITQYQCEMCGKNFRRGRKIERS